MWDKVLGSIFSIIDKVVPDPQEAAKQKVAVMEMQQRGEFKELEERYAAIKTEAASADPWTSRARPSFMYVFYFILLSLTVIGPLIGILNPEAMAAFFSNVGAGFKAIPEELWWTFSVGYLGYTTARTYEKKNGK